MRMIVETRRNKENIVGKTHLYVLRIMMIMRGRVHRALRPKQGLRVKETVKYIDVHMAGHPIGSG
jgi:hypothetical protein